MGNTRQHLTVGRIATYLALSAWAVVCWFPLYWMAIASIKAVPDLERGPSYVPFIDFMPSLASWRFILADPAETLLLGFINSFLIGGVASIVSLLFAGLAVYGLTRCPARRRWAALADPHVLMGIMLSVRVVPPVVLALPIYVLAGRIGLLDSRSLLVCVYSAINLPVALWLLAPVFGRHATEQEEAAQIDGASHIEIFFEVLIPMLLRPLAVTGLFLFILCWNEYLFAAYLASDHAQTLSPWMVGQLSMKEAQAGGEAEELTHMAAAAVFMALPAVVLATAVHRLLARSLAAVRY